MTTHKDHAKNGEPQAKESHHSKDSKAETEGGHHHHTSNPAEQAGAAISHAFRTWFRDTEADGTPILPHQVTKKYHVSSKVLGQGSFAVVKLVVDKKSDRVVGLHMVGADAGEVVQGFAVAMRAGATKALFDSTIGIHPTAAEEFVTMREPMPG